MKQPNLASLFILGLCISLCGGVAEAMSPAERAIERHSDRLAETPDDPGVWVDLSYAYSRRARETADTENYELAQVAAEQALELDPANFAAKKARIWVMLGLHEFGPAQKLAKAARAEHGEDLQLLGMLVDAAIELGDYAAAEKAAERMLETAPGQPTSLTRASYLRELFGDLDGAADLMTRAFQATPADEVEQTAWILVQLAHIQRQRHSPESAGQLLWKALDLFPGYHYALAEQAKLAQDAGDTKAALRFFEARYRAAPHPECLYDVAVALEAAGETERAADAFKRFEAEARQEMNGWDNANRELIRYYIGRGDKVQEGLRIAEMEFARRGDVFTRAAYAEALHAAGQFAKAERLLRSAFRYGSRDLGLLEIATRLDREDPES